MVNHPASSFRTEIDNIRRIFSDFPGIEDDFSISFKSVWHNPFGEEEAVLLLSKPGWSATEIPEAEEWAFIKLAALKGLVRRPSFDPSNLFDALSNSRATYNSPIPLPISLLHAAVDSKFVCFGEPVAVLAASSLSRSDALLGDWYQDAAVVTQFDPDLHRMCQLITTTPQKLSAFILPRRGVLVGAESPEECRDSYSRIVKVSQESLDSRVPEISYQNGPQIDAVVLPKIRSEIAAQRGRPLVLYMESSPQTQNVMDESTMELITRSGPPTPTVYTHCGFPGKISADHFGIGKLPPESKTGASIVLKCGEAPITAADSIHQAKETAWYFQKGIEIIQAARSLGDYQGLELEDLSSAAQWVMPTRDERLSFSGEVALVTGAASGIGKAIAHSLLQRGSAVVGLDINPAIVETFNYPDYTGMVCNVADENAIVQIFQQVARKFGGLDILVLNAGIFPGGIHIEKLSLEEFTTVLNVNFVSNMVILREAFPLLRLAPRYGRVVVVGSKNTRAPGPGAAAYSTSKAALTQLARVAALEWGGDRVRVNVIHPDAVFDTALFTEEVLQARAEHYGMTVDEYKKRNLLKTEITSYDVAELTAEMCGPLFRHMTGGQIQLDGGNDRTI